MKFKNIFISVSLLTGWLSLFFSPTSLQAQTQVCATDSVELQLGAYNGTVQWQESADNISYSNIPGATAPTYLVYPGTITYYRAEITDGTCNPVYSDTAEVIPVVKPTIGLSMNDTICPGDSLSLTASSGVSYNWSTGATTQSIAVYTAGAFSVTVTDTNGCASSSDTVLVYLTDLMAHAGLDTAINCSDTLVLGGAPAATGGFPPYTYLWTPSACLSDEAIANPILNPIVPNFYSVLVTDNTGCTARDTVEITTTGVAAPDSVAFSYSGNIVTWVVPSCVYNVRIKAWGASGGNSTWAGLVLGGNGAFMSGDFAVNPCDTLKILVGQQGESAAVGGGGGGSFVATINDTPLLVAGGGGGASSDQAGINAVVTPDGTMDSQNLIAGGVGGNGGLACHSGTNNGGGGGGFYTDGEDAVYGLDINLGYGGKAFINGGDGGIPGRGDGACTGDPYGGFGGGSSSGCNTVGGGAGGGYSGGGGGPHINNCAAPQRSGGGGGGSYNAGSNPVNTPNANTGDGSIKIIW